MDHKRALSELSSDRKAALQERSDAAGLVHLAIYLSALGLTSLWIAQGWVLWQVMLLPQGILIAFLFTLSHECTHATPFRSPRVNEIIGHAIALPMLLPFIWFRYFHLAHHRFTNDPERDPELEHGPRPETRWDYALYLSGWGYWSGGSYR